MKILWITNRPIAGAERKLNFKAVSGTWMEPTLTELKKHDDIECYVATVAKVGEMSNFTEDSVTYYLLPNDNKKIYDYSDKKHIEQWTKVLDEVDPDIVMQWGTEYAHGLTALRIAKQRSIPAVIEVQGILETVASYYPSNMTDKEIKQAQTLRSVLKRDGILRQQKLYIKKTAYEAEAFKAAGNVIVENEWAKSRVRYIAPNCDFYIHHQGVSETFFNRRWNTDGCERHSVFTCAGYYPLKGLHNLIRAVAVVKREYTDVKLYVPGMNDPFHKDFKARIKRNDYENFLVKLIEELKVRDSVVFLGRLSQEEMADMCEKTNVTVIPSAIENTSTTLREAMAVGAPCIGSYAGGIPETIRHGENGFLYRHEEFTQLADYICNIFSNDELAKKFSQNGRRQLAEYLDIERSTEALIDIYEKIVERGKASE